MKLSQTAITNLLLTLIASLLFVIAWQLNEQRPITRKALEAAIDAKDEKEIEDLMKKITLVRIANNTLDVNVENNVIDVEIRNWHEMER